MFLCTGLVQREVKMRRQAANGIGPGLALMVKPVAHSPIKRGTRPLAGYTPQDIAYNKFSDANGTVCAADLFYEGEACAAR